MEYTSEILAPTGENLRIMIETALRYTKGRTENAERGFVHGEFTGAQGTWIVCAGNEFYERKIPKDHLELVMKKDGQRYFMEWKVTDLAKLYAQREQGETLPVQLSLLEVNS